MVSWSVLSELRQFGRARFLLGRVPIWLDSPHEEESLWISVILPEVGDWQEGRRTTVVRMLHHHPELRENLLLTGQQAILRMTIPKRGLGLGVLKTHVERILNVASRWQRWLLQSGNEPSVFSTQF